MNLPPEREIPWGQPVDCCGCPLVPLSRIDRIDCDCGCHDGAKRALELIPKVRRPGP